VAKVDWNGLSTAISQINQLIQPSFAAKQKIEMDQFKDRVTFEYGLKELAEKQQELESLEESYNNKFNELTQTDASLTRNLNTVNDSGNAVNVASIIGKKSLDEINDNIDRINEESQRFVDAIKEVKSIDDSYKMGQNLSIPLTANENRPQEYLRGLPKTIDGVTTYTPFDSDNSGFLSPDERNVAITQIAEMMVESGIDINTDAFKAGVFKAKSDSDLIKDANTARENAEKAAREKVKETEDIKRLSLGNIEKLKNLEKTSFSEELSQYDNDTLKSMLKINSMEIEKVIGDAAIYENEDLDIVSKDTEGSKIRMTDDGQIEYNPAKIKAVEGNIKGLQEINKEIAKEIAKRGTFSKNSVVYNIAMPGLDFTEEEYKEIESNSNLQKVIVDFAKSHNFDNWTPQQYQEFKKILLKKIEIKNEDFYNQVIRDPRIENGEDIENILNIIQDKK
tara:strand:- start:386 stop:1738 length:1353 start_codon:yes stop_codon:yes gene_type:complete